jgi:hypothetical protein
MMQPFSFLCLGPYLVDQDVSGFLHRCVKQVELHHVG